LENQEAVILSIPAVDSASQTIDFLLNTTHDAKTAERFFRKTLQTRHTVTPQVLTVDKNAAYPSAFEALQQEGPLPVTCMLRQCKYLNDVVELDHRFIKRCANPDLGFGSFRTARRMLRGYETMHRIRKGQLAGVSKEDSRAQNRVIAQMFVLMA